MTIGQILTNRVIRLLVLENATPDFAVALYEDGAEVDDALNVFSQLSDANDEALSLEAQQLHEALLGARRRRQG